MRLSFMRQIISPAAVASGITTIAFLDYLCLLNSPSHLFVYHIDQHASTTLFLPVILDWLLLTAIILAIFIAARTRPHLDRVVWSSIACMFPWVATKAITSALGGEFPHHVSLTFFFLSVVAAFIFLVVRIPGIDRVFSGIRFFTEILLAGIGFAGAIALLQTGWLAVQARHLNDARVSNTIPAESSVRPHQRVVWILLDELAYRQLYGHRLPGLALPAFDQFRTESTVFTDVQPTAIRTQIAVPALMTGHPVDEVRASAQGSLLMHTETGWQPFNQRDTVFADADALGYITSVVGWYNPYCRLLGAVLNSCFWTNYSLRDGLFPPETFSRALINPLVDFNAKILGFFHPNKRDWNEYSAGEEHIHDFTALDHAADAALSDPRNTFVFLHMPVPHPDGIWDRRTARFAVDHSAYVDNLALADLYLAHVRQLLTSMGQWDDTTVVIEGDHAFRAKLLWMKGPVWTAEDAAASAGGRFDPRPALIVKLPGQHTAAQVGTPFPAVRTRPLLDELLTHRISNPEQLEQWACCSSQGASEARLAQGHFSPPT